MARTVCRRALVAAAASIGLLAGYGFGASAGAAPTGPASFHLDRVSCASPTFCIAVGSRGHRMSGVDNSTKTLIERWNGTKWSIVAGPNGTTTGTGSALRDVACPSPSFCMAVGANGTKTIALTWNGTKWSIVVSANPAGVQYAYLDGVSCTSSASCVAVGRQYTPDGRGPTLMERWNGKRWSILDAPTPPGNNPVVMGGVSCPRSTNCYAAGSFDLGGPGKPAALLLHWTGTTFTLAYPGTKTEVSSLTSIACFSPTSCTAVGHAQTVNPSFGPIRTMVERWNGTKWSRLSSPSPGNGTSQLAGVSCVNATQCTAVGDMATPPGGRTLAERGNGTAWSQTSSANAPAPAESSLSGVSCRSATSCIAVGHSVLQGGDPDQHFNTLAERWNGKAWSIVAGPKPSPT